MPDTLLVMSRTLSAPYAELLEAETPQTMTASDAPPNSTTAAAVAFARLLASGDHAMQPDSYTLTGGPALPPQARDTAHHSSDLRATLLGGTAIPADDGHPDAEILDLGRRRAELIQRINQSDRPGHDAAPLLIEWKEVDHLIMELEPKTAAGLAVQLSATWSLSPEPDEENGPTADGPLERTWLWIAMKNAERIGAGAPLAHDRQDTDAPIFAAYSRWSQLVRDCYAATTDEDCERLSEQADEAALDVMTHEPATREGLAAQVFVMLHLEHGGTTDDHLDIDFSALTGGDGPDSAAVNALVDRVKRIGRRDRAHNPYAAVMEEQVSTAANDQLRQAWKDLHTLDTECVPDDLDDHAACNAYNRSVAEACKRLLVVPIQTVGDVAILARFALRGVTIHWGADETIAQELDAKGQPPEDQGEQLMVALWRVVEHLTRQQHIATQLAPVFQQDDDADLLNAFNEWLTAARSLDAIPIEASEEEREPYEQRDEDAVGRLLEFSPKTPRGTAAILRYLFLRSAGTVEAERTILHGGEPNEEDLTDFLPQVLWQLIKALEALPAAANDQHQNADAFADTVAAFEAEAPATLALPLEPTGRMLDAGASAAGITPAQFQAAYAAAVEALKLERAA